MSPRVLGALLLVAASVADAQTSSTPTGGTLVRVVAVFRHGVRTPLQDLNTGDKHTPDSWPSLPDWGTNETKWGHLTDNGKLALTALGKHYADYYHQQWTSGFKVYLWADVSPRTRETADALEKGFQTRSDVKVTSSALPKGAIADPTFHPFKLACGKPNESTLQDIAGDINRQADGWWQDAPRAIPTALLRQALFCPPSNPACTPIDSLKENAGICLTYVEKTCETPVTWKGKFSAASTSSEVFLLKYGNRMKLENVGWKRAAPFIIGPMLALHDFYFDQTQRQWYLAQMAASNLAREVEAALNQRSGKCERTPTGYQFVGLVGHDTNIANLASLLGLHWNYDRASPETGGLPAEDPLPGGALVFELWNVKGRGDYVRIRYVGQSPQQIRDQASAALHRVVSCRQSGRNRPVCDLPLPEFNQLVKNVIGSDFESKCVNGAQVCSGVGTP